MLERSPPNVPDGYGLDEIINSSNSKNKAILKKIKGTLTKRYDEYMENTHALEEVSKKTRSIKIKNALHSKYNTVRGKNETPPTLMCPLCQVKHAGEWDHYLPKEEYPDFSIFEPNLIWACGTCNKKKGAANIAPVRKILNAYYDPIDENIELICKWEYDADILSVYYFIEPKVDADQYIVDIADEHFRILNLSTFLVSEANNHVLPFCTEVIEGLPDYADTVSCVSATIQQRLNKCRLYGLENTHWERALWNGAKEQQSEIVQYIDNQ